MMSDRPTWRKMLRVIPTFSTITAVFGLSMTFSTPYIAIEFLPQITRYPLETMGLWVAVALAAWIAVFGAQRTWEDWQDLSQPPGHSTSD